jgi:pyruvate dehydrogenase E2 component (dihydrolipoamide acetyltransferase)
MPGDVTMPRLGDDMEQGTIARWLKSDGDEIATGDDLVEIETDKATETYEAEDEGVLEIVAGQGDTVSVGEVIARLGEGSGDGRTGDAEQSSDDDDGNDGDENADGDGDGQAGASPVAARMAVDAGLDVETIEGTGRGGQVTKADVQEAEGAPTPLPGAGPKGGADVTELSRAQLAVARRTAESRATVPDLTLAVDVDMTRAVEARNGLAEAAGGAQVPSLADFVLKACALALREHPRANGAYRDARWESYERVNVAVAMAAEDALVFPVVFDADRKSLGEIARETARLAEKAREETLTRPELSGATFTLTDLASYGVTEVVPVVTPPQAAALGAGAVREAPVVRDGAVVPGWTAKLSLACDHRILYGGPAAEFLARIARALEEPVALSL